jgi:hypothetical protein
MDLTLPKFDPAAVNRQLDALLATVPEGQHVCLIANADLMSKKASAALMVKMNTHLGAYVRVSKVAGGAFDADAGLRASFLFGVPEEDGFTYNELVAVFRDRKLGWIRSHINAYKLLNGWEVEL